MVRAFYDRIWNAGDTGAADELLAEDFRFRGSLGPEMRGRGPSASMSGLSAQRWLGSAAIFSNA